MKIYTKKKNDLEILNWVGKKGEKHKEFVNIYQAFLAEPTTPRDAPVRTTPSVFANNRLQAGGVGTP